VIKKFVAVASTLTLATVLSFGVMVPKANAAKVDCAKVMEELGAGKKPAEVAKDLSISKGSVYRCKKKAAKAAKAAEAPAAPAAAAAPAPAAPPAAPAPSGK
jgi:hypothetical protein